MRTLLVAIALVALATVAEGEFSLLLSPSVLRATTRKQTCLHRADLSSCSIRDVEHCAAFQDGAYSALVGYDS